MSQEALAEVCGISLRAVQRIEAGETSPRPHTIKVIAQALSVSVEELTSQLCSKPVSLADDAGTLPVLRVLNFSAMAGLIIPFANVLVPMLLANQHKKLKNDLRYKRLISFQVLWSSVALLAVLLTPLLLKLFTGTVAFGKLPPPALLTYGVLVLLNAFFTIRSAFQLHSGASIYGWVPLVF